MIHVKKDRCGYTGYSCIGIPRLGINFKRTSAVCADESSLDDYLNIPEGFKGFTNFVDPIPNMGNVCEALCTDCVEDFNPLTGTFLDLYNKCHKDTVDSVSGGSEFPCAFKGLQDPPILEPVSVPDIPLPITGVGGFGSITPSYQKVSFNIPEYEFDWPTIDIDEIEELDEIKQDLEDIKQSVGDINLDLSQVINNINNIKVEIQNILTEINNIKVDIQNIRTEITNIKIEIENIQVEINNIKIEIENIQVEINNIKVEIENIQVEINNIKIELSDFKIEVTTKLNNISIDIANINNWLTTVQPALDSLLNGVGVVYSKGNGKFDFLDTAQCEE